MNISLIKTMGLSPLLLLSACAVVEKPYLPTSERTAVVSYDIDSSSFIDPHEWSKRGYIERIDVSVKPARFKQPKTVYMTFADGSSSREINRYDAGKPLLFTYEHRSIEGLRHWPMWCVAAVEVVLHPDARYILKGRTVGEYQEHRWFKNQKVLNAQCSIQIIDEATREVVADSGMKNLLK